MPIRSASTTCGAGTGRRTRSLVLTEHALYHLSFTGVVPSARVELAPQPPEGCVFSDPPRRDAGDRSLPTPA